MVKCFVTGDNHFGLRYEGNMLPYSQDLTDARFKSLENMVTKANDENCQLFFITGDLFHKTYLDYIGAGDPDIGEQVIEDVIRILKLFYGTVIIIPGNHDYENGDSEVWKTFGTNQSNIIVLKEFKPMSLGVIGGNPVVIYPAYCQSENSEKNNLDWIKKCDIQTEDTINIGLAHGTIEGLSRDDGEGHYFKMTTEELNDIPVDAWFIGHAHVPYSYPCDTKEDEYVEGCKIFNAGSHQQTNIKNVRGGYCFIVEIEKDHGKPAVIKAKKWKSGVISFQDITINSDAVDEHEIENKLTKELDSLPDKEKTILRVTLSGTAKSQEYTNKNEIFEKLTKDFLGKYELESETLYEELSKELIEEQFSKSSFVAKFLESFFDDPSPDPDENRAELNMAYTLIKQIQDNNGKKTKK